MTSAFRANRQVTPTRSRVWYQAHKPPGVVLHRARLSSGITLTKAADILGLSPASLALIESGENCHWSTLGAFARMLGLSLMIDLPRTRVQSASAALISAASGLSENTCREVQSWLSAPRRDDDSGLYLDSIEAFLSVFGAKVMVI